MAALTVGQQFVRLWDDGLSDRTVLYALRNVTTGDTANCANEFSVLKRGVILGTTVAGAAAATVAGTTATIPAGVAGDAGYLLVWGCSA